MVIFFTFLFTLYTLNSFAFAGLFLVGNNVFGGNDTIIELPPVEIKCNTWPPGNCWAYFAFGHCYWTGYTTDYCSSSGVC